MATVDKDKIFWRKVDGRTVIVNTETGYSYSLNGSGEALWEGLAAGKNMKKLSEILIQTYAVDEQVALQDVEVFLASLQKEGCIQ